MPKAIRYHPPGGPQALQWDHFRVGPLRPGEARMSEPRFPGRGTDQVSGATFAVHPVDVEGT